MKQGVAGGARLRPGKSVVHLDSLDRMVKTALRDEFEYYLEHQAELVVCLLNKLTLDVRGVSTVRAGIAVRRPVRPHASNRKVISGTHH